MRITIQRKRQILEVLARTYQGTTTALEYSSPFELLVAVVLSAQCTDVRVNIIIRRLFPEYNTPERMLTLGEEGLGERIKDCGLYRAKAKHLINTCHRLCQQYNGQVPDTFEDLISLPGVGRKTANVLLSQLFNVPAIAVDTHVFRVSNRLGLAKGATPEAVEAGLMRIIPQQDWSSAHHWLIWHGRKVCTARKPHCNQCPLVELCPNKEVSR
ncbi:MAG: endonuclease [Firmicutes bacterium]|nr:endonuclease [Bacillota bacterium]